MYQEQSCRLTLLNIVRLLLFGCSTTVFYDILLRLQDRHFQAVIICHFSDNAAILMRQMIHLKSELTWF